MGVEVSASRWISIHPVMFFLAVVILLWAGALLGGFLRTKREHVIADEVSTFKTLESAVLALLGLLLGFTFSMGVSRYDQRKNLEIAEANDITNLWHRTVTLPDPLRSAEQDLVRRYIPVRLDFLGAGTDRDRINVSLAQTDALQAQMWRAAGSYANSQRDPVTAGFLASLAETTAITESRTAAFENRIPVTAWGMLLFIGFAGSFLVGVGIGTRSQALRLVLPVVVAAALSLTLDLDSPRSGLIRVHQHSLERVAAQIAANPQP